MKTAEKVTREMCIAAAAQCTTRNEFGRKFRPEYYKAWRMGWLADVCYHMPERVEAYRWTDDAIQAVTAKYTDFTTFRRENLTLYNVLYTRGELDRWTSHMLRGRPSNGYWNRERCSDEAKRYETRSDFIKGCPAAADAAYSKGWMDEICAHMRVRGNRTMRSLYVIRKTGTRIVYIGLSYDPVRRYQMHRLKTSARVRALLVEPHTFKIITKQMPANEAAALEKRMIERFTAAGWEVANVSAGGQPGGGPRLWTRDRLEAEAKKFATRGAFLRGNRKAYDAAHSYGLLDAIFAGHENTGFRTDIHADYTVEDLEVLAAKYKTRRAFQKAHGGAYLAAYRRGLVGHIFRNHDNGGCAYGWWDEASIRAAAKGAATPGEFKSQNYRAWRAAHRRGLLPELFPVSRSRRRKECVPEYR